MDPFERGFGLFYICWSDFFVKTLVSGTLFLLCIPFVGHAVDTCARL